MTNSNDDKDQQSASGQETAAVVASKKNIFDNILAALKIKKSQTEDSKSAKPNKIRKKKSFFAKAFASEVSIDIVPDEYDEITRHQRLMKLLHWQGTLTAIFIAILLIAFPFMRPVNLFITKNPNGELRQMVPLMSPNLTNPTVLSWAAVSVTEIMTFGFGDIDKQILSQRARFTDSGWDSFVRAIVRQKLWETFKSKQLIVTTVQSEAPLITGQGLNDDKVYQWNIEIPIIMTFVTNNNVMRQQRDTVYLEVIRVPPKVNTQGLAIKSWNRIS